VHQYRVNELLYRQELSFNKNNYERWRKRLKILILGIDGMLGSAVFKYFSQKNYDVSGTSRKLSGVSNRVYYHSILEDETNLDFSDFDYVINCLGRIKQQIDEKDLNCISETYKINSVYPWFLSSNLLKTNTRIIQVATDCVFSGTSGSYTENSKHELTDHYSVSKSLGEVLSNNVIHLRCSLIGPEKYGFRGLFEWFNRLPRNSVIDGYENHMWNGITTLCYSRILEGIILNKGFDSLRNVTHVVPSGVISKYDLLVLLSDLLGRGDIQITPSVTENKIDRTLATIYPERNSLLWEWAQYKKIADIPFLVKELIEGIQ
jgi:dTDP-4-dehydrorhamnose reductase